MNESSIRIWGVGLSRTGTMSLHAALKFLGYRSIHYPRKLSRAEKYEAACDSPVPIHYETLDRKYPGSKFILTIRNTQSWVESMKYLLEKNRLDRRRWFKSAEVIDTHRKLYDTLTYDREKLLRGYAAHNESVRGYFRDAPDKLLTLDICNGEGWDKLCPFLGREIPDEPFPHTNKKPVEGPG